MTEEPNQDEMPRAVCPDCACGSHGACVGDAWDRDTDSSAICCCWENGHKEGWNL